MKKLLCAFLIAVLMMSILYVPVSAINGQRSCIVYTKVDPPDWVITEISPNQKGDGTGGWSVGNDCGEFIEICNASDHTLNLYDYCLVYNGSGRDSDEFEEVIVESTPFKPGDFRDGSTFVFREDLADKQSDMSNLPVNPDTCEVAPGEVVVLWMVYFECYYADWNEGKGLSVEDFRTFWHVPDDVKVIAVDANTNAKYGGNSKNFNVKNKDVGTYGIAKYSEELNQATNTADGSGYSGYLKLNPDVICWATVDFVDQLYEGSQDNYTYNFTWDFAAYAALDESLVLWREIDDAYTPKRCLLLDSGGQEPTVGRLTLLQKMTLGLPLEAGESASYEEMVMYLYLPDPNCGKFNGLVIQDLLLTSGDVFTAKEAGVYTVSYKFANDGREVRKYGERYNIYLEDSIYAPLHCDWTSAAAGEIVSIRYDVLDCPLESLTITVTGDKISETIDAKDIEDLTFTFTMPACDVTVKIMASYRETQPPETLPPEPETNEPTTGEDTTAPETATPEATGTDGETETAEKTQETSSGGCTSALPAATAGTSLAVCLLATVSILAARKRKVG